MSIPAVESDPRRCTCHPDDKPPMPCAQKYALRECRLAALVDAMWQLLDDMGPGQHVCAAAKAQARIAFEPYIDEPEAMANIITLELAHEIKRESEG